MAWGLRRMTWLRGLPATLFAGCVVSTAGGFTDGGSCAPNTLSSAVPPLVSGASALLVTSTGGVPLSLAVGRSDAARSARCSLASGSAMMLPASNLTHQATSGATTDGHTDTQTHTHTHTHATGTFAQQQGHTVTTQAATQTSRQVSYVESPATADSTPTRAVVTRT